MVLFNAFSLSQFSLKKFEKTLLLIFISMLYLINSHFLITKCLILYVLCKEKQGVDKWLGLKGLYESWKTWRVLEKFKFEIHVWKTRKIGIDPEKSRKISIFMDNI